MRAHLICPLAGLLIVAAVSGCAGPSASTPVYDRSQVGQVVSGVRGEVIVARKVVIKGQSQQTGSTGTGAKIGSAAVKGAITGNTTSAVSNVVGAIVGSNAGARFDDKQGEEITIMLEDGKTVTVVQDLVAGVRPLSSGERVILQSGGANAKVVRDDAVYSDVVGAR